MIAPSSASPNQPRTVSPAWRTWSLSAARSVRNTAAAPAIPSPAALIADGGSFHVETGRDRRPMRRGRTGGSARAVSCTGGRPSRRPWVTRSAAYQLWMLSPRSGTRASQIWIAAIVPECARCAWRRPQRDTGIPDRRRRGARTPDGRPPARRWCVRRWGSSDHRRPRLGVHMKAQGGGVRPARAITPAGAGPGPVAGTGTRSGRHGGDRRNGPTSETTRQPAVRRSAQTPKGR